MKRFMSAVDSTVVAWCCFCGLALGDESKTIEVRTIGIPPYGIISDTDSSGIYYDAANLLAKEAGYQVNNRIYPYARIVNELKTGQTDMTIMIKYRELHGHVIYIAPLPALKTVVVGLEGTRINSIEDLKGKRLAYLRGAKFSDEIDDDPEIHKQTTNDFVQGAKMLAFGRVDAIIGPLAPILSAVEGLKTEDVVLADPFVVAERTPWVQISKQSVDRLSADQLKQSFLNIVNRGGLKEIRDSYLSSRSQDD